MNFPRTLYASVLLFDDKIKFWSVSGTPKKDVYNWNKYFYYSDEDIGNKNYRCETISWLVINEQENEKVFYELAPQWFKQWPLIEGYKAAKPY